MESGERLAVLAGPPKRRRGPRLQPDGSRIATASVDGEVRLFDVETAAQQLGLRGSGCAVESGSSERFRSSISPCWVVAVIAMASARFL